jgi:hypothetical protein
LLLTPTRIMTGIKVRSSSLPTARRHTVRVCSYMLSVVCLKHSTNLNNEVIDVCEVSELKLCVCDSDTKKLCKRAV